MKTASSFKDTFPEIFRPKYLKRSMVASRPQNTLHANARLNKHNNSILPYLLKLYFLDFAWEAPYDYLRIINLIIIQ